MPSKINKALVGIPAPKPGGFPEPYPRVERKVAAQPDCIPVAYGRNMDPPGT